MPRRTIVDDARITLDRRRPHSQRMLAIYADRLARFALAVDAATKNHPGLRKRLGLPET